MYKNGGILILDAKNDQTNFALVNIYNPNIKTEQVKAVLDVGKMLETIKDLSDKYIVLAGATSLDSCGGKTNSEKETYNQIY